MLADRAMLGFISAIAVVILVLPGLLGSVSSVVSVILAVFLVPYSLGSETKRGSYNQPAMLIFVAVFVALALTFVITARNPGNVLYAANFLALLLAPSIYHAAQQSFLEKPSILIASLCACGAAVAASVAAFDVFVQHLPRAVGLFSGGNLLGRTALILGFVSLVGVLAQPSPYRAAFYLGPVFALFATILSGSRGAMLAVPPMVVVFAVFLGADHRYRKDLIWLGILAALGVMGLGLLPGRFTEIGSIIGDVLSTGGAADSTTGQRLTMLHAAWEAFKSSPWLGYGWANFAATASAHMDMELYGGPADPYFQFHSDIANFAVAGGVIGVVCWVGLLTAPLIGELASRRGSHSRVKLYICSQMSVGYIVFGLTDMSLGYDLLTTLFAFLTAMVLGSFGNEPPQSPSIAK